MVIEGHDAKQEALPEKHQVVYAISQLIASICHGNMQSLQQIRSPLPLKFHLLCDTRQKQHCFNTRNVQVHNRSEDTCSVSLCCSASTHQCVWPCAELLQGPRQKPLRCRVLLVTVPAVPKLIHHALGHRH